MDDILSIRGTAPQNLPELPAKSPMPWVWFGFFFVGGFIIEEALMVFLELNEAIAKPLLIAIALAGWSFWLFCVSRFHAILEEVSRKTYPISNAEAVGKHFIPFYNFYWIFRWPAALSNYLNARGQVKMVSGNVLGFILLLSILVLRFLDGGIGLRGIFAVVMYISAKLNRHIQLIPGVAVPPVLDPSTFRQAAAIDVAPTGS